MLQEHHPWMQGIPYTVGPPDAVEEQYGVSHSQDFQLESKPFVSWSLSLDCYVQTWWTILFCLKFSGKKFGWAAQLVFMQDSLSLLDTQS